MKVTDTKLPLPEFPTLEAIAEPLSTLVQTGLDFFAPAPVSLAWEHRSSLFNAYQQQSPQIKLLIGLAGLALVAAALPLILELGAISAVPEVLEVTEGIIGGPAANAMMQGVRIIYVEDEEFLSTMMQAFFKRESEAQKLTFSFTKMTPDSLLTPLAPNNLELLHFTTGEEAQTWFLKHTSIVHGIFWDHETPGLKKGCDAMLEIAENHRELPQILFTSKMEWDFPKLQTARRLSPNTLHLAQKTDFVGAPQWIISKAIEYSKKRQV